MGTTGFGVSRLATVGRDGVVGSAAGVAAVAQADAKTTNSGQPHKKRKLLFRNPGMYVRHVDLLPATTTAGI